MPVKAKSVESIHRCGTTPAPQGTGGGKLSGNVDLYHNKEKNRHTVSTAEDAIHHFHPRVSSRGKPDPRYVSRRAGELNEALWWLAKFFFLRYNEANNDCVFQVDKKSKTIIAT